MKKLIAGIVLASVVLYAWGFVYWGLGPYRTQIWKASVNEVDARSALRKHFPGNGTYYVPGFTQEQGTIDRSFAEGPVAFVHMLAVNGRPMVEPSIMVQGFLLNLVIVILITVILRQIASAFPRFRDRAKLVVLIGLTAAVAIDGGEVVWWQMPAPWKVYQGVYDFSVWLIAGLIMANFVDARLQSS